MPMSPDARSTCTDDRAAVPADGWRRGPLAWRLVLGLCVVLVLLGWALAEPGAATLAADTLMGHLRHQGGQLQAWHAEAPMQVLCVFCATFVLLSALALPGCAVLALGAGALFGPWLGALLVTLASAAGATLSFLAARRWLRAPLRRRLGPRLAAIDAGLARDGARYLLSLRLAPVIPYAVLNPLMGLTAMPAWTFFWVSAAGMLAGSALYTLAGAGLLQLDDGGSAGPLSLVAMCGLAVVPWLGRAWRAWRPG